MQAQATIRVTINGAPQEVPGGLTVQGLVAHLGLDRGPVAVEVNREIVPRAQHAGTFVNAGDAVEIVHLVGGG
jgi:sulfur carrier protein